MITYKKGDIFDYLKDNPSCVVPHVVNIHSSFGSGFAYGLSKNYPLVKSRYHEYCDSLALDERMGKTQLVKNGNIHFINMFAQTLGVERPLFYNHLAKCMDKVAQYCKENSFDIHTVAFGSGLAGGNWDFIKDLVEDCWLSENINVTIYLRD